MAHDATQAKNEADTLVATLVAIPNPLISVTACIVTGPMMTSAAVTTEGMNARLARPVTLPAIPWKYCTK
jgi:hypothetical protein|tara:strand:- start:123 stop:332 length:210 start_codon:yes stop_codon:yes gene_type:complete